jgi:hypothetical protein
LEERAEGNAVFHAQLEKDREDRKFMGLRTTMNSHDRILCVIDHKEPDHVPLFFALMGRGALYDKGYGFTFGNLNRFDVRHPYSHRNQIQKVKETTALGLDDMIRLEQPLGWAEEYVVEGVKNLNARVRSYLGQNGSKRILQKVYHTPDGNLKTVVEKTDDWPHGNNIPVFSDFNVSRAKEFLIKTYADIKRLKHLLGEPKPEEYRQFKEEAAELRQAAEELGVVFEGGRTSLGDSLVWLLGIQNLIYGCFDTPDFIIELLDSLYNWERKRLEIIIDEGIELLFHSAWYEITDFWTPDLYRKILKPRLAELVDFTREAEVKFVYIITKSYEVLADDFLDLQFDCLYGADPIQGNADLNFLHDTFKGKVCLWGGINSAVTLGRGTKEEIEEAVESAVRIMAPGGGFVLFPVDAVLPDANPWGNVEILLKKWREIGSYPINIS